MRRICVLTGSRSEYGLLKPVMTAIREHPRLELVPLVAGMHLLAGFGRTVDQIASDGFSTAHRVRMTPRSDVPEAMARSVGQGIVRIARELGRIRPDVTLVLGDRVEALAAAIASAYMNIPVAHIHGGDRSRGGLDESARHAITKFSHLHFAATRLSRERILRLGERPERVFLVGAPGLDAILQTRLKPRAALSMDLSLDFSRPVLLVLQHPVSTEPARAGLQMRATLEAVRLAGLPAVVIYPNADSGGRAMIREIAKCRRLDGLRAFASRDHATYLSLLKQCGVLVGNSSSGMIESACFHIPVVNVGTRQHGRERADNVLDVPHEPRAILAGIRRALGDRTFRKRVLRARSPYGDGKASGRIARRLAQAPLGPALLQKQILFSGELEPDLVQSVS